jgi:hypothetical protein
MVFWKGKLELHNEKNPGTRYSISVVQKVGRQPRFQGNGDELSKN